MCLSDNERHFFIFIFLTTKICLLTIKLEYAIMANMDINELNKKQLILLTLLITFVVSIATGIVTVSLMKQMPTSVPQTINNIIQRTIEKVSPSTTSTPEVSETSKDVTTKSTLPVGDGEALVSIYSISEVNTTPVNTTTLTNTLTPTDIIKTNETPKELGQGVIISDIGLILVDSSILIDKDKYKVVLNKTDFEASILKKFSNGFTILKITTKTPTPEKTNSSTDTKTVSVDKIQ